MSLAANHTLTSVVQVKEAKWSYTEHYQVKEHLLQRPCDNE